MALVASAESESSQDNLETPHVSVCEVGGTPAFYSFCMTSLMQDSAGTPPSDDAEVGFIMDLIENELETIYGVKGIQVFGPTVFIDLRWPHPIWAAAIEYWMFCRVEKLFGLPEGSLRVRRRPAEPFSSSDEF